MSAKINIAFVLRKHFLYTLKNADGTRVDRGDVFLFVLVPLLFGGFSYFSKSAGSDNAISIIITASSIFAGLLLSLLMLVYDQSKRTEEKLVELNSFNYKPEAAESFDALMQSAGRKPHPLVGKYQRHLGVLEQLVVNISYSIIASLFVIFVCVLSMLLTMPPITTEIKTIEISLDLSDLFFSFGVAVSVNLVMTLLMIVKRVIRLIDDK